MLRKRPYLILLLLSALLWCAAAWRHARVHRFSAATAAKIISADLSRREAEVSGFLEARPGFVQRAAAGALTESEAAGFADLPAAIFIYNNDTLRSWNNASAAPVTPAALPAKGWLRQDGAVYSPRVSLPLPGVSGVKAVVLYPVLTAYPFENDYLVSHYNASQRIPPSAQLSDTAAAGSAPVLASDQAIAGYISLSDQEAAHHMPDVLLTLLVLFALAALMAAIQSAATALWRQKRVLPAGLLLVGITVALRALLYKTGLPFELDEWPLFSPLLYASSALHPSLGDLLLNGVLVLWAGIFLSVHIRRNAAPQRHKMTWVLTPALMLAMACIAYSAAHLIATLALSPNIGFDIVHLYAFDADTMLGLITVAVTIAATAILLRICFQWLRRASPPVLYKYGCVIGACLVIYATGRPKHEPQVYMLFCGWLLLLTVLMGLRRLSLKGAAFSPATLFWIVFFCGTGATLLQHYINLHELDTRKSFAGKILNRRDDAMEWSFSGASGRIARDTVLKDYLSNPLPGGRAAFAERLSALYLNRELNNYTTSLFLFDKDRQPLNNSDTGSYDALLERLYSGAPTATPDLYYFENAVDDHDYLAELKLTDSNDRTAGYLFIDLAQKKEASETVLPELLQPSTINKSQREAGYGYAVYSGGRLVAQSPDYPFPYYIAAKPGLGSEYEWRSYDNFSMLRYRPDAMREAVVVRSKDSVKAGFTLFSYLFGLQLAGLLILLLCRYLLKIGAGGGQVARAAMGFTLRQRIQLSMLGIVLVSFLVIAVTTIAFFRQRYEDSNRRAIQGTLQNAQHAISQYLSDHYSAGTSLQELAGTLDFRRLIAALAQQQRADVNLYDATGVLAATSQEDIYSRGILSQLMRPQALAALQPGRQPLLIRTEEIGRLSYNSSYVPLRAPGGSLYGYINVPFFSSEKEINAQVSNILVALVNLYAFIFLLSSLLAVLTTRWLTRTLAVIINQFNRLGLAGNELLEWPYEDEIGVLVREYNKMVRKVEESAALLAQSEREGAWREMAKQVAHEIKNPLTPMKLNIQHLQSALRSNHPKLTELTKRMADSMLEQIDNLSYIATEFSSFAKLPEARPEVIVLNEFLEKTVPLYYNEPGVDVTLSLPEETLTVHADRSQVNRIITNLLQNAVQAIDVEAQRGTINISLTAKNEGAALIAVQDNGRGIEPDVAERIFRPYFTTKSSGSGLGLAMTRKMVELWKGRIWFESEPGRGTTFFVELPLIGDDGDSRQA